jgi:hypothetical protein
MSLAESAIEIKVAFILSQLSTEIPPCENDLYWLIRKVCKKWSDTTTDGPAVFSPAASVIHSASEEFFLRYSQNLRPKTAEELTIEDLCFRMELIEVCLRQFSLFHGKGRAPLSF